MMRVSLFADYQEDGWKSMDVYTDNLARQLERRVSGGHVHRYVAMRPVSSLFSKTHKCIRYFFRYCINPLLAPFHQGDINHIIDQSNAHLLYVLDRKKTVITCHDLIVPFWQQEKRVSLVSKIRHRVQVWRMRSLRLAEHLIAVSSYTKQELMQKLSVPEAKITVVPEGVERIFRPAGARPVAKVRETYALPKTFLLHVGSCAEYKNMEYLIRLFASLGKQYPELYLVKVGSSWTQDLERLIDTLHVKDRIRIIPYAAKEDLPPIYSAALCLVHPSIVEGFGLTVLEAMACGCPVVLSDIPPHRELVGNAGVFFSPDAVSSGKAHVVSLIKNPAKRTALVKKGLVRARAFRWEQTAKLTAEVYRDTLRHI
jgi:glycosyltransferase involved in cell wall biosynthesis